MPGNRVNVRLVVKPKAAPFVDVTPPKPTVVLKSGFPNWFKAVGIVVGVSFVFVLMSAIGSTLTPAATPAPTIGTPEPTPLPSRLDRVDGSIEYGQTVTGSIYMPSNFIYLQQDVWKFTGQKGDVITASVNVNTASSDQAQNSIALSVTVSPHNYFNYIAEALNPPLNVPSVGVNLQFCPEYGHCSIDNFTLPDTGTYALVVISQNDSYGKLTYNLTLTKK